MKVSDYSYQLPESLIALHPPELRGASRLLVLNKQTSVLQDDQYSNLDHYLQKGDVLVINNTRVIPARLLAKTAEGDERELLLLEQHGQTVDHRSSLVMYRRRLRPKQQLHVGSVIVQVNEVYDNGTAKISSQTDLWDLAEKTGSVPLPPYMHRHEEPSDRERYQTIFAKNNGSVAAPTASLNLTDELLERIKKRGVQVVELTLHVGLGTFLPIRADDITEHTMHQEYFEIPKETVQCIRDAKNSGRRVIAVGTTVTRTLEYAAQSMLEKDQSIVGEADIFIYPGYKFRIVDALVTNFHAPRSTVLMMAAAFAGWEQLRLAYEHGVAEKYSFLSYGDSMLIY